MGFNERVGVNKCLLWSFGFGLCPGSQVNESEVKMSFQWLCFHKDFSTVIKITLF